MDSHQRLIEMLEHDLDSTVSHEALDMNNVSTATTDALLNELRDFLQVSPKLEPENIDDMFAAIDAVFRNLSIDWCLGDPNDYLRSELHRSRIGLHPSEILRWSEGPHGDGLNTQDMSRSAIYGTLLQSVRQQRSAHPGVSVESVLADLLDDLQAQPA